MSSHGEKHIIPFDVYIKVFLALIALTALTVAASRVNFGPWNTVIAMAIASIKASLVLAFFMHLKYDDKLYLVAFGTGVFFLIVMYFFCWMDAFTRIFQGNIL